MPLSGRRAEAERNHGRIFDAAREVFVADPEAPISAVASRAGVGISALYRRYPSKEHLLRALATEALTSYIDDMQAALDSDADPWTAYVECLHRVIDGGSQALAQRLAGTFTPTPELTDLAKRAGELETTLFRRARRSGELRDDVTEGDIVLLLEGLMSIQLPGADDDTQLRHRYLTLLLQALHNPVESKLPGSPPDRAALAQRWRTKVR
jgi:AcrR family transcriptional regulator